MSALKPIAGKLGKLVRLLGSDRDGEVLGAVQAIKRALQNEKLDLHALADAVEQAATNGKVFSEEEAREIYQAGVEDGIAQAEQDRPIHFTPVDDSPSWHEIACACRDAGRWHNEREHEFVLQMVNRTVMGGAPTEKQASWLRKIYARQRY